MIPRGETGDVKIRSRLVPSPTHSPRSTPLTTFTPSPGPQVRLPQKPQLPRRSLVPTFSSGTEEVTRLWPGQGRRNPGLFGRGGWVAFEWETGNRMCGIGHCKRGNLSGHPQSCPPEVLWAYHRPQWGRTCHCRTPPRPPGPSPVFPCLRKSLVGTVHSALTRDG